MSRKKKAPPVFQVHRKLFAPEECDRVLWQSVWTKFRPVPKWLGNFNFCIFGEEEGKKVAKLPVTLKPLIKKLADLVPNQDFNTVFLQKYEKGQFVKPHRDPRNNLGHTVIGVFGEFEGAESVIGRKRLQLLKGDALVQRCNLDGLPRPLHRVSEVTEGTRYALILNTIS